MKLSGITDRNHQWVKSYLSNRRQFIQINEKEKSKLRDDQLWCYLYITLFLCIKSNLKQHQNCFKTGSLNQLITILKISLHPTTVYHHLNRIILNAKFQSEAPHYGRAFLETLRKYKNV